MKKNDEEQINLFLVFYSCVIHNIFVFLRYI